MSGAPAPASAGAGGPGARLAARRPNRRSGDPLRGAWLGGAALVLGPRGRGAALRRSAARVGRAHAAAGGWRSACSPGARRPTARLSPRGRAGVAPDRVAPRPACWRLGGIAWRAAGRRRRARQHDRPDRDFRRAGLALVGRHGAAAARLRPLVSPHRARRGPGTRLDPPGGRPVPALIALSLATHLAFLDAMPWRFHFDEGYAFTETMRFYRGPMIPLFTTTWHDTSLPSLWFAFAAGMMRFTGVNIFGVRLAEALHRRAHGDPGLRRRAPGLGADGSRAGRLLRGRLGGRHPLQPRLDHQRQHGVRPGWSASTSCCAACARAAPAISSGPAWRAAAMYTFYGARIPLLLAAFVAYLLVFHWRTCHATAGPFWRCWPVGFLRRLRACCSPLLLFFLLYLWRCDQPALEQDERAARSPSPGMPLSATSGTSSPLPLQNVLGLEQVVARYATTSLRAVPARARGRPARAGGSRCLVRRWRQPASFLLLITCAGVVLAGAAARSIQAVPSPVSRIGRRPSRFDLARRRHGLLACAVAAGRPV